jgi:hypothetical protein
VIENQSVKQIPSAPYKGYAPDSYAFCDIWHTPKYNKKGQPTGKWGYVGVFVSYVDAKHFENNENELHKRFRPHPAANKAMRLFKNDMVMLMNAQGNDQLMRVCGYSATANKLDVRSHLDSGSKQNHKAIPVLMETMRMHKVHVTIDGRILR